VLSSGLPSKRETGATGESLAEGHKDGGGAGTPLMRKG